MIVKVERAGAEHLPGWATLRAMLWPGDGEDEHRAEIAGLLADSDLNAAFVALDGDVVVGFAEASVRRDHVNGADTSPVAFLEGIAVAPGRRREGIARALCAAVEKWSRDRGLVELGSDADWENEDGRALHAGLGFEERERVVFYRKRL